MTMYKIKRFGITSKSEVRSKIGKNRWGVNVRNAFIPNGATPIPSDINGVDSYNFEWPGVEQYNIIDKDSDRNFIENYKWLQKMAAKEPYENQLLLRLNQLLKDMKGTYPGDKTQYVTSDSSHSTYPDKTHMLASLNGTDYLVYSKNIDGEHRLVYEIHRPKIISNKVVSEVIIDDISDHMYNSISYAPRTTVNNETGEEIKENQPSFKGRHKTRKYSDEEITS